MRPVAMTNGSRNGTDSGFATMASTVATSWTFPPGARRAWLPSKLQLLDLAPVPLRWSPAALELQRRCVLQLIGESFTRRPAGVGLTVKPGRHRRGPAQLAHAKDVDVVLVGRTTNRDAIADADHPRAFGALVAEVDLAAVDRLAGQRSRLEPPRRPQPLSSRTRAPLAAMGRVPPMTPSRPRLRQSHDRRRPRGIPRDSRVRRPLVGRPESAAHSSQANCNHDFIDTPIAFGQSGPSA